MSDHVPRWRPPEVSRTVRGFSDRGTFKMARRGGQQLSAGR
ncbi:MAG: hypothetical protein ACI9MR_003251, partial [Myxococcota bacterium]